MRRRLFVCAGFLALGVLGSIITLNSLQGQPGASPPKTLSPSLVPPVPAPPAEKAVVPAAGVVAPATSPAPAAATPTRKPALFDRFRNYDQLPELTREIVFTTQRGMEWLARDGIHQPSGRFIPGLNPALGKATNDDDFIRQALAAMALARAAKLTSDEKYAVRAGQTILSLLAETPKDQANAAMRKPTQPDAICNRVGSAAHLAMAIYELPDAAPELRQCAEELCQFLRTQLKTDGAVQTSDAAAANDGSQVYAGSALAALAMSHRAAPATWKQEALARALGYYRQQFKTAPHSAIVPWLTLAFAEMHLQTKEAACAEFVFEMADWSAKLQHASVDLQRASWRGGFSAVVHGKVQTSAPTIGSAGSAMVLADACRMIRQMDQPDAARYDRYRAVLTRSLQFLSTLQYGEENTVHFASHFRPALVGAFHSSHTDGNIRLDQSAAAVCAFTQFLIAGADR